MVQLTLFEEAPRSVPPTMGAAAVSERKATQILAKGTGHVASFDFTLNPYVGCQFGCAYCYAAFFVADPEKARTWGTWVEAKTNALDLLARRKDLAGKSIYIGSVTDPYQPLEGKLGLTREILEYLAGLSVPPKVVIQTRSPLVERDIAILKRLRGARVQMSVTTDDDAVRQRFEPGCPSIERRLETLARLREARVKTAVFLCPLLPVTNPEEFGRRLAELRADRYVVQPFHSGSRQFTAGTRRWAIDLATEFGWTGAAYRATVRRLQKTLPNLKGTEVRFPDLDRMRPIA
ncbi:MAG: radical SAM protein [Fimbriimonadaceae bacterium]|nr:radical SAM protein [Fimbriimonadaceae bacterium]